MTNSYVTLNTIIPEKGIPLDLFSILEIEEGLNVLDYFAYVEAESQALSNGFSLNLLTRVMANAEIPIPFIEGCSLIVGYSEAEEGGNIKVDLYIGQGTESFDVSSSDEEEPIDLESESMSSDPLDFEATLEPTVVDLKIRGNIFSFRFNRDWLCPVTVNKDKDERILTYEEIEGFLDIDLGEIELQIQFDGEEWSLDFNWIGDNEEEGIDLPPCMVSDSGVIIEATNLGFNFSGSGRKPESAPNDWKGVLIEHASVFIPQLSNGTIQAENLGIGTGGLYGRIEAGWNIEFVPEPEGEESKLQGGPGGQVLGMEGALSSVGIEFNHCIPTEFDVRGQILLPFFDEPIEVSIGIDIDGDFLVSLADTDEDGIYTLRKEGILEAKLESITIEKDGDLFIFGIGGSLKPLVGDVNWPEFEIEQLSIDSTGNVHLDGGWIDVPESLSFDFNGFQMEITEIGFGTEEPENGEGGAWKWIGLSGGIQIAEGLEAGASVEGLKIKWNDQNQHQVELRGVGVNFEVPDVLLFSGEVEFFNEVYNKGFKGEILLNLMTIGLEIEADLLVGKQNGRDYFYIYLDLDLPAAIPLGASGAGLYGFSGLFAYNMEPDKEEDEHWFENWYLDDPEGVTDVDKWKFAEEYEAFALGAGVTLGTLPDNGYLVSGKMLLVLVLPGPIIMLEGRANFLCQRSEESTKGFKALAVLDNRAGQFLLNIQAEFKYDDEGNVLDIHGGAEAFFDYSKANNWHLYIGEKEPREKRFGAQIIRILKAETYFMLDPTHLAWGFWFGFDERWEFGPVGLVASAWVEGGMDASWAPEHFWGKFWMHGELGIKVFWFEFGLYLDAGIEGNTPTPYYVLIGLKVGINLPSPIPDLEIEIDLKWEDKKPPPIPLPLKEGAIEHELIPETILLPRHADPGQAFLLPNYDENQDGLIDEPGEELGEPEMPELYNIPIIPLDAKPVLTFNKAMEAFPDYNQNNLEIDKGFPPDPLWQKLEHEGEDEGLDDYEYKFDLTGIALAKLVSERGVSEWRAIAGAGDLYPIDRDKLSGSWLPAEDGLGNPVNTKLRVFAKSKFEYSRYASRDYLDTFAEDHPDYPCLPPYEPQEVCIDFGQLSFDEEYTAVSIQDVGIESNIPFQIMPGENCGSPEISHTMQFLGNEISIPQIHITLPVPACLVQLEVRGWLSGTLIIRDRFGNLLGLEVPLNLNGDESIKLEEENCEESANVIKTIEINFDNPTIQQFCLLKLCYLPFSEYEKEKVYEAHRNRTAYLINTWSKKGHIFEPDSIYRLQVQTRVTRKKNEVPEFEQPINEYLFFQTSGPPGYFLLEGKSVQIPKENSTAAEIKKEHPLNNLKLYVEGTIPRTGQDPFYRAYDVGIAFNQDYVELMYKMASHDLAIYLYDNNGELVRDTFGRVLTLPNAWGQSEEKSINIEEGEVPEGPCIELTSDAITYNDALTNAANERYLLPQKLYIARLVPMLLRDTFDRGSVEDRGLSTGDWMIRDFAETGDKALQPASHITDDDSPKDLCPGMYAILGEGDWKDYRMTVRLASGETGAIGALFCYQNEDNYFRFDFNIEENSHRLIQVAAGIFNVLAHEEWAYDAGKIYEITAVAVGKSIQALVNGNLIFNIEQEEIPSNGKIALYCWNNPEASFLEVVVEDLSPEAKMLYGFPFTTSRYANFFHHIHSFNDRAWKPRLSINEENWDEVWTQLIPKTDRLEISLLGNDSGNIGLVLSSPEPIEWERVELYMRRNRKRFDMGIPGKVKLVTYEQNGPRAKIQLLIREPVKLEDWKIEYADIPAKPVWKLLYTFKGRTILSRYNFDRSEFMAIPGDEGHYLIDGDRNWENYQVTVDFELKGRSQAAGIIWRYRDENNFYKLTVSNNSGIGLVKKQDGVYTFLGVVEERFPELLAYEYRDEFMGGLIEAGVVDESRLERWKRYRFSIKMEDVRVRIYFNNNLCFEIEDDDPIQRGSVGVFYYEGTQVKFKEMQVVDLQPTLLPSGKVIEVIKDSDPVPISLEMGEIVVAEDSSSFETPTFNYHKAIRILDNKGRIVHQRSFRNRRFTNIRIQEIISSPDGSAAIIRTNNGAILGDSLYQLGFTFHREKELFPTLHQWGNSDDELVLIDFVLE